MLHPLGIAATVAELVASELRVSSPLAASLPELAMVSTPVLITAKFPEVKVLVPAPVKNTLVKFRVGVVVRDAAKDELKVTAPVPKLVVPLLVKVVPAKV